MHKDIYYISSILEKILNDSKRDDIENIKKYLCISILKDWDIFSMNYNSIGERKFESLEMFLAEIFGIEYSKMKNIIKQLEIYKNYKSNEQDVVVSCCNVKINL